MPVNDIVEVRVMAYCNNQLGEMVLHYKILEVNAPEPAVQDIADQCQDFFKDTFQPLLSTKADYIGCTAQRIFPVRSVRGETIIQLAGTGGSTLLPTQTSGLITKFTTLAGRTNRGRAYVPFPAESDNDDALASPNAAYKTKLSDLAAILGQSIITAVGGGDCTMAPVIYHRTAHTSIPVAGCQRRNQWATQRRRGAYGAHNAFG